MKHERYRPCCHEDRAQGQFSFPPLAVTANLISGFACATAMWLVVAAVAIAQGGHLSRQPLRAGYEND